jgi:hypothetical protein
MILSLGVICYGMKKILSESEKFQMKLSYLKIGTVHPESFTFEKVEDALMAPLILKIISLSASFLIGIKYHVPIIIMNVKVTGCSQNIFRLLELNKVSLELAK